MFMSTFPHALAMRVIRLSAPIWILIALELSHRFSLARAALPELKPRRELITAVAVSLFLLLSTGLQWSYRNQLIPLDTPKGRVLVRSDTKGEFEMLRRHYKSGETVLALPEGTGAVYFAEIVNPIRNDYGLIPVLFTPAQLQEGLNELTAQNFPPIIVLPHVSGNLDWVLQTFKPSKHLEEFKTNPWNDFINTHYTLAFRDGPATGLVRKEK